MDYFKIKVMELLVFLRALELSEHKDERPYFYSSQIEKIKAVHKLVTENPAENYTTENLAKQFNLSVAALKTGFKGVYVSPIYTYIRTHKIGNRRISQGEKQLNDIRPTRESQVQVWKPALLVPGVLCRYRGAQ